MTHYLLKLIGKKITNVAYSKNSDIDQNTVNRDFVFSIEEYSLAIFNKTIFSPDIKSAKELSGSTICSIEESNSSILITTTNGLWLAIDLQNDAYSGPEAMVLHGPDNLCIVWN